MKCAYFPFGRYHGKESVQGSTFLRMQQMEKYWPDFKLYNYGENPDTLIFQKVYITPDYRFPAHFEGIKILDICDPDWFDDCAIVETCNYMDAVTCPTENLATFLRQFHNNVHVIPDRFDIENLPEPKKHDEPAKTVAWFGYSHNSILLKPAMNMIEKLHLNLIVISDDDPIPDRWGTRKRQDFYTFVKYKEETFYEELQKADFAVLPEGMRPVDHFKSNNKTIKANLAGLPVAKNSDDVNLYMDAKERRSWIDNNYAKIKKEYDIRKSVNDYRRIISEIANKRNQSKS